MNIVNCEHRILTRYKFNFLRSLPEFDLSPENKKTLTDLEDNFSNKTRIEKVRSCLRSHGFAPIPVYGRLLRELGDMTSNFAVVKMKHGVIEVFCIALKNKNLTNISAGCFQL